VPESECVVAVNATPLGLNPDDPLPVEPALLSHCRAVIDLTYRREGESRWTVACRKQGLEAIDGREVLLVQGAASWRLWFPDRTPPLEIMRAALDGRLD
jgi:shikimate 5-dehydrogenase